MRVVYLMTARGETAPVALLGAMNMNPDKVVVVSNGDVNAMANDLFMAVSEVLNMNGIPVEIYRTGIIKGIVKARIDLFEKIRDDNWPEGTEIIILDDDVYVQEFDWTDGELDRYAFIAPTVWFVGKAYAVAELKRKGTAMLDFQINEVKDSLSDKAGLFVLVFRYNKELVNRILDELRNWKDEWSLEDVLITHEISKFYGKKGLIKRAVVWHLTVGMRNDWGGMWLGYTTDIVRKDVEVYKEWLRKLP